jgi:hypothetical protein
MAQAHQGAANHAPASASRRPTAGGETLTPPIRTRAGPVLDGTGQVGAHPPGAATGRVFGASMRGYPAAEGADVMTNATGFLDRLPWAWVPMPVSDTGCRIAVLDDDPTGSQVHDVAVVTVFEPEEITARLDLPHPDLRHRCVPRGRTAQ